MIAIQPLEINDVVLPHFSAYVYVEEIEYTSEVKRTMTGKIITWPTHYYIPTINVVWNFLTHEEYQQLANLVRQPNFKMRYFDTISGTYKTAMWYCPQNSYNALVAKYATLRGYENVSLRFICTNDDVPGEVE